MARSYTGSTSNRLSVAAAPIAQFPATILAWFKVANVVGEKCCIRIGTSSGNDYAIALEVNDAVAWAITGENSAYAIATKSGVVANQWHLGIAVFESAVKRTIYLDGVAGTPETTSRNFANGTINLTTVGSYDTGANPFNGELGPVAVFDGIPTANEIAAYWAGTIALEDFLPGCLLAYYSMNTGTSGEPDRASPITNTDYSLALTGTVGQSTQPTVPTFTADGALRVLVGNQRAFTLNGTTALVLAGAHTWPGVIQFNASAFPTAPYTNQDYRAYLDTLAGYGHNYTRCWTWDTTRSTTFGYTAPLPYARSGTAGNSDGGNKFDLTTYDSDYFTRLVDFVSYANTLGLYVGVVLFEQSIPIGDATYRKDAHPFKSTNNTNTLNGDTNADGSMAETYDGSVAGIVTVHNNYISHVLGLLGGYPNVIYELSNEPFANTTTPNTGACSGSHARLRAIRNYIVDYELANCMYQHLIYRSPSGSGVDDILGTQLSSAGTVSPHSTWTGYSTGPSWTTPQTPANPPFLYDSDHTGSSSSMTGDVFWRAVCQGHFGLAHMEDHFGVASGISTSTNIRNNLGYIRTYTNRMGLAACGPKSALASTGYCLANPGTRYLAYQPGSATFTMDLSALVGTVPIEFLNTNNGATSTSTVTGGSSTESIANPFSGASGWVVGVNLVAVATNTLRMLALLGCG